MLRSLLLGPNYLRKRAFIRRTEFLPQEELSVLQAHALCQVLRHAVKSIPFYNNILPEIDTKAFGDPKQALARFPIIDKQFVREHCDTF